MGRQQKVDNKREQIRIGSRKTEKGQAETKKLFGVYVCVTV